MATPRDWIDYLQAGLTPAIAIAGIAIGALQWCLSAAKLRLELFEKRLAIFDAVRSFLAETVREAAPSQAAQFKFLSETRGALFLFDQEIADYLERIWKTCIDLEYFRTELGNNNSAENRGELARKRRDAMNWTAQQLTELRDRFAHFMVIQRPFRWPVGEDVTIKRGLLRMWVVCSAAWILAVAAVATHEHHASGGTWAVVQPSSHFDLATAKPVTNEGFEARQEELAKEYVDGTMSPDLRPVYEEAVRRGLLKIAAPVGPAKARSLRGYVLFGVCVPATFLLFGIGVIWVVAGFKTSRSLGSQNSEAGIGSG
ncbi:MAG: hypothetical protein ISP90_08075 [Nevskia sp.]|nr:hypothetical protein [Nevskia sp.]